MDYGYLLERLPRRFKRVHVPTIYVLSSNIKISFFFLSENFQFSDVKFSTYLNRRVFVMDSKLELFKFYRKMLHVRCLNT